MSLENVSLFILKYPSTCKKYFLFLLNSIQVHLIVLNQIWSSYDVSRKFHKFVKSHNATQKCTLIR